jgi:hypothetical protein
MHQARLQQIMHPHEGPPPPLWSDLPTCHLWFFWEKIKSDTFWTGLVILNMLPSNVLIVSIWEDTFAEKYNIVALWYMYFASYPVVQAVAVFMQLIPNLCSADTFFLMIGFIMNEDLKIYNSSILNCHLMGRWSCMVRKFIMENVLDSVMFKILM